MKPLVTLVLFIMLLAAPGWAGHPHTSGSALSPAELVPVGPMPYDTPPKLIRGYAPRFPHFEMLGHKSGVAEVVFTIGTDGRTSRLVVEASADAFGGHYRRCNEVAVSAGHEARKARAMPNGRAYFLSEPVKYLGAAALSTF